MEIKLKPNERIDDLEYKGLKIIQNKEGFCFGVDSVLLSDFAKDIPNNAKVIDLGTGTGIVSILLCGKTNLSKIIGVDIQEDVCNMAKRSIKLNNLEDKVEIINKNVKNLSDELEEDSFDAIVMNPPYKKHDTGLTNENKNKLISRHEIEANLEDFIKVSAKLLKDRGALYIVHRPDRLVDIISLLRIYKLEPKKIRFVCPSIDKKTNMVLIKTIKNAKPFLEIEKNLYIYDEYGKYTGEVLKIYEKGE